MAEPILAAARLSKTFALRGGLFGRGSGNVTAVQDVTLRVAAGEALGLVGASGCGKSTLARLLVGLLSPSAGDVEWHGQRLADLRGEALTQARRRVQLIFQDPTNSLNPRLTIEEILSEPLIIHRLAERGARRRARVDALLEAVQLPPAYRTRLPRELSGGERQRVGIARALALEPELLICDEPIASLDVSVGTQILELLRTLRAQRTMALLFISHDLRAVAWLCERIAVMSAGRLTEVKPTEELLSRPSDPHTELLLRCADLDLSAVGV